MVAKTGRNSKKPSQPPAPTPALLFATYYPLSFLLAGDPRGAQDDGRGRHTRNEQVKGTHLNFPLPPLLPFLLSMFLFLPPDGDASGRNCIRRYTLYVVAFGIIFVGSAEGSGFFVSFNNMIEPAILREHEVAACGAYPSVYFEHMGTKQQAGSPSHRVRCVSAGVFCLWSIAAAGRSPRPPKRRRYKSTRGCPM